MSRIFGVRPAFGRPGMAPRWTRGDKDGVGTAYNAGSRVWFTLRDGILTEAYYPTVDRPQLRDMQLLVTDGRSFFHEEKRDLRSQTAPLAPQDLGYRIVSHGPQGRYSLMKEVIADPHTPCILQRVRLEGDPEFLDGLRWYVLAAPHLMVGGQANDGHVVEAVGQRLLAARKEGVWLLIGASVPFSRLSCGYVGVSDGWTDLADNLHMDWEFDSAPDGNIALTGELDLRGEREFTLALAFGDSLESAATTLAQSLGTPFAESRARFLEQWERPYRHVRPLDAAAGDDGTLFRRSVALILGHEDKTFPGAIIASLSIPWGEARGDEDQGGYHLVWTRDMVNSATALLAAGNTDTALRALIYLCVSQEPDGGFPQNFWIDGRPYWTGIQLDEVAFPILLAHRLQREGRLKAFDPYPMVRGAAAYLIRHGPATGEERWEEAAGYSPSTLAVNIAALVCAAELARGHGESGAAHFFEEYADFLEQHVERWTVTERGELVPGIPRHYIRIQPVALNDARPDEDPNRGLLEIVNQPPGAVFGVPARNVVDAGFLELVRYGIRRAGSALMEDSLRVVDAVLRVETPYGPCWHRYNHDGYGQREDGGPYLGWGKGRAWPLLTGERGHYELAAGRDPTPYLRAMERFANGAGLLPEQVWDEADRPARELFFGRSPGSAMPLMWAHAEYIKLLRSVTDGAVYDFLPPVAERYLGSSSRRKRFEIWKPNRQPGTMRADEILRIQVPRPFRLHWTRDEWSSTHDTASTASGVGIDYVDLMAEPGQRAPFRFTFQWSDGRWEGRDYEVEIRGPGGE
ncbi:MAG TPA: glycoside hydrolase family 15 protein [Longimicrobiaceae bacterium]|nr:glycoside hydrolase family 15 protein [Longimicrobiaceae bacterium]